MALIVDDHDSKKAFHVAFYGSQQNYIIFFFIQFGAINMTITLK